MAVRGRAARRRAALLRAPIHLRGLDTAGLLAQLKDPSVAQGVAHADLVTVTIGANDLVTAESDYFAGTCGGSDGLDCFRTTLPSLRANLTAVLDRIRTLAAGHAPLS